MLSVETSIVVLIEDSGRQNSLVHKETTSAVKGIWFQYIVCTDPKLKDYWCANVALMCKSYLRINVAMKYLSYKTVFDSFTKN
jgi:hypothetical protein